jgi:hypothetical protein
MSAQATIASPFGGRLEVDVVIAILECRKLDRLGDALEREHAFVVGSRFAPEPRQFRPRIGARPRMVRG